MVIVGKRVVILAWVHSRNTQRERKEEMCEHGNGSESGKHSALVTLHSIGLPEIQKWIKYIKATHETMTLKVDCMEKTLQDRIQYTGNKRKNATALRESFCQTKVC